MIRAMKERHWFAVALVAAVLTLHACEQHRSAACVPPKTEIDR
jgi:hypothetical protein